MIAKEIKKYMKVNYYHLPNSEPVAECRCNDASHFKQLPSVIECDGKLLGKTGWDSDHLKAFYKTVKLARICV